MASFCSHGAVPEAIGQTLYAVPDLYGGVRLYKTKNGAEKALRYGEVKMVRLVEVSE